MVLPILGGILGAGLATLAATHGIAIPAYNKRQGQRMRGILDDLPEDAGRDAQIQALAMGGILSPEQGANMFSQYGFDDYSSERDYREQRGLNQQQHGFQLEQLGAQYNLSDRNARLADDRAWFNQTYGGDMGLGNLATAGTGLGGAELQSVVNLAKPSLVNMESGGNYGILGPVQDSGDRAHGIYQIMGNNIGPWQTEMQQAGVINKTYSASEFLDNVDGIQDKMFDYKFGQYVQQGGVANAYSRWHSGVDLQTAIQQGRKDQNMSTVDYTKKLMTGFGNNAGIQQERAARFTPELRTEVAQTESALQLGEDVLHFAMQPPDQRQMDRARLNEIRSEFETTYLPRLQALTDAGAMQEAELELFKSWLGDPFRVRLSDSALGKLRGVMNTLEKDMNNQLQGAQVDYSVSRQGSAPPEPIKPYTPPPTPSEAGGVGGADEAAREGVQKRSLPPISAQQIEYALGNATGATRARLLGQLRQKYTLPPEYR